jgi:hypothetical protein
MRARQSLDESDWARLEAFGADDHAVDKEVMTVLLFRARRTLRFSESELCLLCEAGEDKSLQFFVAVANVGPIAALQWLWADLRQTILRRRLHKRWGLSASHAIALTDRMRHRPLGTLALIDSLERYWTDESSDSRTVAEFFRDLGIAVG